MTPPDTCCELWPFCHCVWDEFEAEDETKDDDRPLTIDGREVTPTEYYEFHYDPEPRG